MLHRVFGEISWKVIVAQPWNFVHPFMVQEEELLLTLVILWLSLQRQHQVKLVLCKIQRVQTTNFSSHFTFFPFLPAPFAFFVSHFLIMTFSTVLSPRLTFLSVIPSSSCTPHPLSPSPSPRVKELLSSGISRADVASSKHLRVLGALVAPAPPNKDSGYVLVWLLCNLAAG